MKNPFPNTPPLKEKALREAATCARCGKKIGETRLPLFYLVTIERHGVDLDAVNRKSGLEAIVGHPGIATALSPCEGTYIPRYPEIRRNRAKEGEDQRVKKWRLTIFALLVLCTHSFYDCSSKAADFGQILPNFIGIKVGVCNNFSHFYPLCYENRKGINLNWLSCFNGYDFGLFRSKIKISQSHSESKLTQLPLILDPSITRRNYRCCDVCNCTTQNSESSGDDGWVYHSGIMGGIIGLIVVIIGLIVANKLTKPKIRP